MRKVLLITLFLLYGSNLIAQSQNQIDSIAIKKIVFEFYDWYIMLILEKNYEEINPQFIENENGMTSLDLSKYIDNLRRYHFSDSLIEVEKQSYNACILHLKNVKYSDFRNNWKDLDDFESADCDFGNTYHWIGLMEPIECFRFKDVQIQNNLKGLVKIEYCSNESNNKKVYWGGKQISLEKQNNEWKIIRID